MNMNASFLNTTTSLPVTNIPAIEQPTNIIKFPDLSPEAYHAFAVIQTCILIPAVLGNAIILLLICFNQKLRTTTNILIANLAAGDILLAIAVIPFDIDKSIHGYFRFNTGVCEMSSTAFFLSLPASAINLLIMTFERFHAVRFPLQHRTGDMFTKRRIAMILFCSWVYIVIVSMLPVMGWRSSPTLVYNGVCMFFFEIEYAIFLIAINFVLPLILIIAMNLCILKVAKQSQLQRYDTRNNTKTLLTRSMSVNQNARNQAKNKTTRIIAILVGIFVLCWLPYIISTSVNVSCQGCVPRYMGLATMTLIFLNSAINPILYGVYKPQIRGALSEAFSRLGGFLQKKKRDQKTPLDKEVEETCL